MTFRQRLLRALIALLGALAIGGTVAVSTGGDVTELFKIGPATVETK